MPANGWPMPHSRFWIARAKANASRPQPWATDIGSRKKPKVERTPKPIRAIRQPQTTMTVGVRQDGPETRDAEDGEDMGRALRAVADSAAQITSPAAEHQIHCWHDIYAKTEWLLSRISTMRASTASITGDRRPG